MNPDTGKIRFGIRWKWWTSSLLVILPTLLISELLILHLLRQFSLESSEGLLRSEAGLVRLVLENALSEGRGLTALDPQIRAARAQIHSGLTLIRPDGSVIGEPEGGAPSPQPGENPLNAEEIQGAIQKGEGVSVRYSEELQAALLSYAVPLPAHGEPIAFIRLSLPLTDMVHRTGEIEQFLLLILLPVLVLSIPVALIFSNRVTGPIDQLTKAAERVGQGDLSSRAHVGSGDELERLSDAFNRMAEQTGNRFRGLSEDRAKLSAILDGMIEGVMVLDSEGKVLLVNPALERMFGLPGPVPRGSYHYELIRHRELNDFIEELLNRHRSLVIEIGLSDLRDRYFQVQASMVAAPEGMHAAYAILVFHDVTELRRLERVRKDFVANVSHELRTPLTSIKGYIEALVDLESGNSDQAREFLSILQKHTQRMESILADLLQLARLESGKEKITTQRLDLKATLEKIVPSLGPQAEKKHQRIEMDVPEGILLDADPEKLPHVVMNLLDNAIKYTPDSGRIVVGGRRSDGGVELFVKDNGIGIPPADLARVFERFYRVDRARSREVGGTGLGLSIVKHIVEVHGGRVSVESRPGAGSTFKAWFPNVRRG